jgi:hypothetical protein
MEIFVGNIPKGTRPAEIRRLIKDAVKEKVFQRLYDKMHSLGRFDDGVDIEIVKQKGRNGAGRYCYLVIRSEALARLTLDALNNAEIRGKNLNTRKYVNRDPKKDRRAPNWRELPWEGKCRRVSERRKTH